jgi:NAD(P)-dependent dehydrogenase (short-subunit alcohol dehydrogenase family)
MEPARLEALARDLGPNHIWVECDVTDQAALEHAATRASSELGGIDVVVANAGVASNGTVAVAPAESLVRTIDVNLSGVVRTVSATLPHVRAAMRTLLWSPLVEWLLLRRARRLVPRIEREVSALGRSFGRTSVGAATGAKRA